MRKDSFNPQIERWCWLTPKTAVWQRQVKEDLPSWASLLAYIKLVWEGRLAKARDARIYITKEGVDGDYDGDFRDFLKGATVAVQYMRELEWEDVEQVLECMRQASRPPGKDSFREDYGRSWMEKWDVMEEQEDASESEVYDIDRDQGKSDILYKR